MFSETTLLVDRAVIVAAIEDGEIERLRRFGAPQPQRIGGVGVIAEDRRVVGNADHGLLRQPAHAVTSLVIDVSLGVSAELDLAPPTPGGQSPRDCRSAAICRSFRPASHRRSPVRKCRTHSGCRSRSRESRAWPANRGSTPPAGRGRHCPVRAPLPGRSNASRSRPSSRNRPLHLVIDAEIDQVVAQVRTHQELGRQIGDRARTLLRIGRCGADPALQKAIAHHVGERHVVVVPGGQRGELALHVEQAVEKFPLQRFLGRRGPLLCKGDRNPYVRYADFHLCSLNGFVCRKKHARVPIRDAKFGR